MAPSTVAGWVALGPTNGLNVANYVPQSLYSLALTSAQRKVPAGSQNAGRVIGCQAFLIVRGVIYYKNTPGDCGLATSSIDLGAQVAGAAGSIAVGIASMAGAVLPGIGIAVAAIQDIFASHAAAVADEQSVICKVAGVINQVIPYYDNQVRTGALDPSDAAAGMQTYISQVNEQLATIEKQCNAACVYSTVLAAHADFVQSYYPLIAPVQAGAHAPGASPVANNTTPGGVVQVGGTASGSIALASGGSTTLMPSPANPNPSTGFLAGLTSTEKEILLGLVALFAIIVVALTVKL